MGGRGGGGGLEIRSVVGRWGRRNGDCVGGDSKGLVLALLVCVWAGGREVRLTGTSIAQDLVDLGQALELPGSSFLVALGPVWVHLAKREREESVDDATGNNIGHLP